MFSFSFCQTVKNNGSKILLSLGGWGNDVGFRSVANSPELRSIFISNLIDVIDTYGYDGVDIDWEHPNSNNDRQNLNFLVAEMDSVFYQHNPELLITMAVPTSNWSGQWYDFSFLRFYIDFFNAMTYDIHGGWSSHAGHNSPLYSSPVGDPDGSCETGINYLAQTRGLPTAQINLGLPFWGKQYNTSNINMSFTGDVIDILYKGIPNLIGNGWSYEWDYVAFAPYLRKSDFTKIITFDDMESIKYKCQYAQNRNLGGVMIWALTYDLVDGEQKLVQSIKENYLSSDNKIDKILSKAFSMKSYPNPFNSNNTIELDVKFKEKILLELISLDGRFTGELLNREFSVGKFNLKWDIKNINPKPSSGVFFIKASGNKTQIVEKIIYLK
jgi:chitinase